MLPWLTNLVRIDEGKMRRVGYARVSSQGQSLDRQIAALRAERCDVIFREKASAKSIKGRPELEKAIDGSAPATCWCWRSGIAAPGR
jgi:DNA invertase Pin-like site-specific DNA recombinase